MATAADSNPTPYVAIIPLMAYMVTKVMVTPHGLGHPTLSATSAIMGALSAHLSGEGEGARRAQGERAWQRRPIPTLLRTLL